MTPWTDAEINRFQLRVVLFERRGLGTDEAERLADTLAARDQERDDRRMCIECSQLQQDGGCFAAARGLMANATTNLHPVKTILMRCEHFAWQKPTPRKQ